LGRIRDYDWLVFTSGNGVDGLVRRLFEQGKDARALGGVKIAALGSGTAERLGHYHLTADLSPSRVDLPSLAAELMGQAPGGGFLLAHAEGDRPALAEDLEDQGAAVDQIAVYGTVEIDEPIQDVSDALAAGEIGWVTVTSSPTARSLARLYGSDLGSAKIASISPLTSATLRELGYPPTEEASPHTVDGLVEALLEDR
jgi:uroporphyrinogen III methyltransferase/synthase